MAVFVGMRIFMFPAVRWMAVLAYATLVYYLCLLPAGSVKSTNFLDTIHFDKWVHVMMYFGMWSMLVWGFKGRGKLVNRRNAVFVVSAMLCLAMGASIEYFQLQVGRGMDWWDELANFGGVVLAWLAWVRLESRWPMYRW
jgi:hypothetical protein